MNAGGRGTTRAAVAAPSLDRPGRALPGASCNILAIVIVLLGLGLVMVASTGPTRNEAATRYVVLKHALWLMVSLVALFLAYSVDYHAVRRYSVLLLLLSMATLVGVLFLGVRVNGARRWYRFGGFLSFQPSEVFKVALVLYMADFLAREQGRIRTFFKGFLQPVFVMSAAFVLILLQPDFGTALLVAAVTFAMLFVAGIRIIHVLPGVLASIPMVVYLALKVPYRWVRILTFVDPWRDPQGAGYQIIQSLLALGSGGLCGVGLGNSQQKLLYLPEAGSDFVFAIIGEELGLVGCSVVILLFALLFWYGIRVALRAPDLYGTLLAFGLTLFIGLQAAVNIAVVTCSAPTKGLALPFVSSGGSSLVATLAAVGLLMNVASYVEDEAEPEAVGAVRVTGKS